MQMIVFLIKIILFILYSALVGGRGNFCYKSLDEYFFENTLLENLRNNLTGLLLNLA